jgi:hypothetical protein
VFVVYEAAHALIAPAANDEPPPFIVTPVAFAGAARSTPATTAAEAAAVMIFLNINFSLFSIYRLFDVFILGTFC